MIKKVYLTCADNNEMDIYVYPSTEKPIKILKKDGDVVFENSKGLNAKEVLLDSDGQGEELVKLLFGFTPQVGKCYSIKIESIKEIVKNLKVEKDCR